MVSAIHGLQLAVLGVPGILAGLAVGAVVPVLVLPLLRSKLPLPRHVGLYPWPLLLAAVFGLLVGIIFALRPLRRAAGHFRRGPVPRRRSAGEGAVELGCRRCRGPSGRGPHRTCGRVGSAR